MPIRVQNRKWFNVNKIAAIVAGNRKYFAGIVHIKGNKYVVWGTGLSPLRAFKDSYKWINSKWWASDGHPATDNQKLNEFKKLKIVSITKAVYDYVSDVSGGNVPLTKVYNVYDLNKNGRKRKRF